MIEDSTNTTGYSKKSSYYKTTLLLPSQHQSPWKPIDQLQPPRSNFRSQNGGDQLI